MASFTSSPVMSKPKDGPIFYPEDLRRMRHAYNKARQDGMMAENSEAQLTNLAKAIVSSYRAGLTEEELVLVAMKLVK